MALVLALAILVPLVLSSAVEAAGPYDLRVSTSPNRSGDVALAGQTVSGNIYVFTSQSSTSDVSKVEFFFDDPSMSGAPRLIEKTAPYDFAGTVSSTIDPTQPAKPFDTTTIADGSHTITARITHTNATQAVVGATFTIQNGAPPTPALSFNPSSLGFSATEGSTSASSKTTTLGTNTGTASFSVTDDAAWLDVAPATGSTPQLLTATADPTGLAAGTYTGTVMATAPDYVTATLPVTLTVSSPPPAGGCKNADNQSLSPLPCSDILVTMPYSLGFSTDAGKIVDKNGVGTGFTMVDPPTNGTGYVKDRLTVDTISPGTMTINTTAGLANTTANSQDNALGVGIKPGKAILMKTTLRNPPTGTGKFEQAGLWFGNDEDNYVKLVLSSGSTQSQVQVVKEVAGVQSNSTSVAITLPVATLELSLRADPATGSITASYSANGGASTAVGPGFTAPPAFFSSDAAGIDPTIGTNTFGGVFASNRNSATSLDYVFDSFSLEDVTPPPPPPSGTFNFNRFAIGGTISSPTSMAFGPDGKLYVTELLGKIHKLTLNSSHQVTNDQVITTLGTRLTLGIAIDPASTATNVIVWVAHSDPDLVGPDSSGNGGGAANSSIVSKLTGTSLGTKTNVITGLPRSQANHSTNSIHFGPDGKLYIDQGGNTGAGAPNTSPASLGEFGLREEQPLSAAVLVAAVNATGFDGTCANTSNIYGPPPCTVTTYATGLRNSYDFVWHSNGTMYAPDNGASVGPTYPKSPTPPCTGLSPTSNDPGDQNDFLMRVQPGKYYGHPNPSRSQCVFKNGSWQGVAPLANYVAPIKDLGAKKSADGMIEYKGNAFSGALDHNLLITNYSQGDDVTRICLSADGTTVTGSESLVTGFNDPLPIVEGPDGTIYVGEFGGNKITALVPTTGSGGCSGGGGGGGGGTVGTWTTKAVVPVAILDAGGTALSGKLYFVAGKTSAGRRKTMYAYTASSNTWATKASLPTAYPAVENPAVVAYNGKLYAFGGSTAAFSGAVTNAAVYNPSTNAWSTIASMPVARGGATAQVIGTKIYVVGGLDSTGNSLSSMSIYDPAANTWSSAASMSTRRDNPGSAVLTVGGASKLFVFGGRTRDANGTTINGTLNTVEMYDPATNTWTAKASMPTGRRTMAVGTLNGKAQLMGGEKSTTTAGTFPQNEEYDAATNTWRTLTPMLTPRHGAVAGTISGFVYVAGGGPNTGSSYTNKNEAFTY